MNRLIATKIIYNFKWDMFYIKTDEKDYEGYMNYIDDKFILDFFSEKYIVEFGDYNVVKDWLMSIVEKYYFNTENLEIDYEKLHSNLPFIDLEVLCVKPTEYLVKIKSDKTIFSCNVSNYYVARMESNLRNINLFYSIGEGKILNSMKEEALNRYDTICKGIINF